MLKRDLTALWGLWAASLFSMIGCTVGPDFVRPEPPRIEHYTSGSQPGATVAADGQAQRFEKGAGIVSDWWRLFNSSKLDTVIREAMANNPTLQAAQASLRQSQDNLRAGYGVFYPQVDAGFDATRQKLSQARFGGSSASSTIFNLFTLSATVSYALDIFGGERRAVEGLQAQVDFQQYMVLGTYLALSGNIVNTVIARAAYREEIKATEQTIALEKEQIRITELQAQAGTVPYSNVLSLRSQLAATEATLPPLRQKLNQADHLLATLVGHAPAEWTSPQIDMADLTLPADLPITLPSQLVRQRPDILTAEAQLHGASAEIGVATAALFPNFTLNGAYGAEKTSFNDLFKNTGSIWSLGANITAPLFHGGTLQSRRSAAIEGYNQSLANYRQAVLGAFAQVADTLRALENDADALQAQSQALSAAQEALRLVQANYQAGIANYLQVLVADYQYHQARIGYLQALAQRFQDTVALFVALGGGWWNAEGEVAATH
ncbi:MAG: efflux transporter outer membrane subunit [Nitrospirae bacterium]|nr:efflux transporter outer membrane subunit [Nitrospirota bacterium]